MNTAALQLTTVWRHRALIAAGLLATYMQALNISLPNAAVLHQVVGQVVELGKVRGDQLLERGLVARLGGP